MRTTYGILDLLALVSKLLAPFVDPLRAEFATRAAQKSTQTTPTAEPVATTADVRPAADSTGIPAESVAGCVAEVITHQPDGERVRIHIESMLERCEGGASTVQAEPPSDAGLLASPPSDAGIPASATDEGQRPPLFVRVGTGRGARYRVDDGHAPGDRYRRRVAGKRVRYEPAR